VPTSVDERDLAPKLPVPPEVAAERWGDEPGSRVTPSEPSTQRLGCASSSAAQNRVSQPSSSPVQTDQASDSSGRRSKGAKREARPSRPGSGTGKREGGSRSANRQEERGLRGEGPAPNELPRRPAQFRCAGLAQVTYPQRGQPLHPQPPPEQHTSWFHSVAARRRMRIGERGGLRRRDASRQTLPRQLSRAAALHHVAR